MFKTGQVSQKNQYSLFIFKMILGATFWMLCPTVAQAQFVDYEALESLFGEPITTSVTGTPQRASEVPANMTIVDASQIRQSGARTIPQVLERVAGLDVLQGGNTSFDVGVRGYQQPFQSRLLVLIDGRQVFIDDYSRTIWDNLPVNIDDVRQIEVVKGADSALFGSNAAGGVINIITYSPLFDTNRVASFSVGSQSTFEGDGTYTIKGDWGGSKTSLGELGAQNFHSPRVDATDSFAENPFHGYIANSTVVKLAPTLNLATEVNYSKSGATTNDIINNSQSGAQKTTTYSFGENLEWDGPYGRVTSRNYLNHSFVNLNEPATDDGAPYGLTTNLFMSQWQDQLLLGEDHTVRLGFEYRYKDFKNSGIQLAAQNPSLAENTYALNGAWVWQINPKLTLTNAARLDYQDLTETGNLWSGALYPSSHYNQHVVPFSANSDIVYKLTPVDSFRIGYGRGVSLPSFLNYGYSQIYTFGFPNEAIANSSGGYAVDYEGNPHLKPSSVEDYSTDYDRQIKSANSDLKLSLYYQHTKDVIIPFVPLPQSVLFNGNSTPVYTPANAGDSHAFGGELEFKGHSPSGYRWDASYSYARVTDDPLVSQTYFYSRSTPVHNLRLNLGYSHDRWEFDAFSQYETALAMIRGCGPCADLVQIQTTPSFMRVSGRIGYQLTDYATLALSGTDLTQARVYTSPYPAIERQILGTLTLKY